VLSIAKARESTCWAAEVWNRSFVSQWVVSSPVGELIVRATESPIWGKSTIGQQRVNRTACVMSSTFASGRFPGHTERGRSIVRTAIASGRAFFIDPARITHSQGAEEGLSTPAG